MKLFIYMFVVGVSMFSMVNPNSRSDHQKFTFRYQSLYKKYRALSQSYRTVISLASIAFYVYVLSLLDLSIPIFILLILSVTIISYVHQYEYGMIIEQLKDEDLL